MKTISVVIPTYNEELNIPYAYERVTKLFNEVLLEYQYKILFVDNGSKDGSRKIIRELASKDYHIQYIFYTKNFGFSKSTFYGLTQAEGDCAVLLFCDMQDPPELIEQFIQEWESGEKIVAGIKSKSKESKLVYFIRSVYYKVMSQISEVEHIEQFTGFGLYDRSVLDVLKQINDPLPYLRGIIAEIGPAHKKVYYEQVKRERGKTSFSFIKLYDVAMLGITSYSKAVLRAATFIGAIVSVVSILVSVLTFILKIAHIVDYEAGMAAVLTGVFFFGGVQLFFLGLLGEYIYNINTRTMGHPLVVEFERYNIGDANIKLED